jgi:hypothetical protein
LESTTIDVSKIQVPVMTADSSQKPVNLTSEMTLDQTVKSSMVASLAATPSSDAVKIPYGAIIRHSDDGLTTVFDSTGKQLFSASDAKAAIIDTPNGPARANHVLEVPDKSVIFDAGNKMYVFNDQTLIVTVIDETSHKRGSAVSAAASTYPSQYIEGTETNVLPNIGQFTARWNVPKSPVNTMAYPPTGPSHLSSITIWNGVFGRVGSDTSDRLLQPVLEWYVKIRPVIQIPQLLHGQWQHGMFGGLLTLRVSIPKGEPLCTQEIPCKAILRSIKTAIMPLHQLLI